MARFKTSARTVDMLGRQQIESLPTALSELFKNARDAYATYAIAEYYRTNDLLVVHDNGLGMSRQRFESHWLTIATDAKFQTKPPGPPKGMGQRSQLGEKGIGRFAIGALGRQVLVVSKRDGHKMIVAFINWEMFELSGIDLEAVPIGLLSIKSGTVEGRDIDKLKKPLLEALDDFRKLGRGSEWAKRLDTIGGNINAFTTEPYAHAQGIEPIGLSGTGTHFFISPVSDSLALDLAETEDKSASALRRTLHGFTDDWLGTATDSDFIVDFLDHKPGGDSQSLLVAEDFFSASDFDFADHSVVGTFDADGKFVGSIRIFDNDNTPIEFASPLGVRPRCGPFGFRLGLVQGQASESRLEPESYAAINNRLEQLGGLYVYMDGVRVQPYGRRGVDYLEIELRRSRGASYYYFSHRRMFGAVSLSTQDNPRLVEKAGREGFNQGRAYNDFRQLLINLFKQLAAVFFRADGLDAQKYTEGREGLKAEQLARKERERIAKAGRRKLRIQIAAANSFLDGSDISRDADVIVSRSRKLLEEAKRLQPVTVALARWTAQLTDLLDPVEVEEPEGFAVTEAMRLDLNATRRAALDLHVLHIEPALKVLEGLAAEAESRFSVIESDASERAELIERHLLDARAKINSIESDARSAGDGFAIAVESAVDLEISTFDRSLKALTLPRVAASSGWITEQAEFERQINDLASDTSQRLARITRWTQASQLLFESDVPGPHELAAAADAEIIELRARADAQLELVQLGMALSVVDHEFRATISNIRRDVRKVGSWAKKNPPMRALYEDLRRDFDHLDSYLTLLTPLQRRVRRAQTTIRGVDMYRFLEDLFRDRLQDAGTTIRATRSFKDVEIIGYASTFYPVFINLVDNSLYWIGAADTKVSKSEVVLDARGSTLIFSDNGPGVELSIADRIFDFGFTTRVGGRGLGLSIASQVLDRAGWSIRLNDQASGAEFLIMPQENATAS